MTGPRSLAVKAISEAVQEHSGNPGTAAATAIESAAGIIRQTLLTLSDVPVTVGNTTGVSFGSQLVYTFPEGRILLLGATMGGISFDLTDEGNATPIDDTMGGDVSLGSTAAGDGTLTGADVDIIPATSIDPISAGITGAALAASAQFNGTTTPVPVYLNVLIDDADVADTASDVILVSCLVTLTWVNLGDY